jgi:hypothetical protein
LQLRDAFGEAHNDGVLTTSLIVPVLSLSLPLLRFTPGASVRFGVFEWGGTEKLRQMMPLMPLLPWLRQRWR